MKLSKGNVTFSYEEAEQKRRDAFIELYKNNPIPDNEVLRNLGLFIRRQDLSRILFMNDLYKKIINVHGVVAEFGVRWGQNLALFESFRGIYEPYNLTRKIIGFDTFEGFPPVYNVNDDLKTFDDLLDRGDITEEHYDSIQRNIDFRSLVTKRKVDVSNISSSNDFTCSSLDTLQDKIDYLKLDNICLVKGTFEESMSDSQHYPEKIMAGLLDCDLYQSYNSALPFIWKRMSIGSYMFLDEYYSLKFPGARIAVNEFFDKKNENPQQHKYVYGDFERWFVQKLS